MKILLSSHAFAPSIGGIETCSLDLARAFVKLGHEVRVVTQTPAQQPADDQGLFVLRKPSKRALIQAIRWCEVFWHNNLSLQTAWPVLLVRRPIVITHAGSYCVKPVGVDLALRLKHWTANRSTSIAISRYIANWFKTQSYIIPNAYDVEVFANRAQSWERGGDLVFLGRLVTEKGLDILLQALAHLRTRNLFPRLTIVGSGPELQPMKEFAATIGVQAQVQFVGPKRGLELAEVLNQHKILVVPSRYEEPFGIVALEGIACGCVVVGSKGGGLPEAIGPCGVTFRNGDAGALADAIEHLLRNPEERVQMLAEAPRHLAKFQPTVIAESYLEVFRSVIEKR
jgi:glycosyltransferase involved in cell wall biosynthesis